MLTLRQTDDESPPRLHVAPRTHAEPTVTLVDGGTCPLAVDVEHPPVVAVPASPGELAERLEELLADATDPEAWEAVLAGCAGQAGSPDLARVVAPLVGAAREAYGRGVGGVWYLDPEHDAARLVLALAGRPVARRAPTWGWADHRRQRVDEVLDLVADGRPLELLSTPTEGEGRLHLEAHAERAGRQPDGAGPADRHQALLRLPGPAQGGRWEVRAERSRQGTLVTLSESAAGDPARPGRGWRGLAEPSPRGGQRIPTREADLLRWASPHEADRFDAWAAERLARNIDWWEADWDERRLFTRLRTTHAVPGLPGRVLLAVGLAAKQPTAHQPAVAVARRLLDAGLLGPRRFAETLGALSAVLDPSRLARTLEALRHTHARAVASVLDGSLPAFDAADRRVADLVRVYTDACDGGGHGGPSEPLAGWLRSVRGSETLAETARRALAVVRA
jgi:hypothetical protein